MNGSSLGLGLFDAKDDSAVRKNIQGVKPVQILSFPVDERHQKYRESPMYQHLVEYLRYELPALERSAQATGKETSQIYGFGPDRHPHVTISGEQWLKEYLFR